MNKLFSKKSIIVLITLVSVLVVGIWIYNHSYIEINSGDLKSESIITITKSGSNKPLILQGKSTKVKKLLSRGDYEVLVTSGETSYLASTKIEGLLKTSVVNAALKPENLRSFVGNNPGLCMYDLSGVLASDPCGGSVDELEMHLPATNNTPSYTKKAIGPSATLEGLASYNNTVYAVVRAEKDGEGNGNYHLSYVFDNSGLFVPASAIEISGLDPNKIYKTSQSGDGIIIYSDSIDEAFIFNPIDSKLSPIKLSPDAGKDLGLRSITSSNGSYISIFSNSEITTTQLFENPGGIKAHGKEFDKNNASLLNSEVFITKQSESVKLSSDKLILEVVSCGELKYCILYSDATMEIRKISSGKLALEHSLSGVLGIKSSGNNFQFIKSSGVYSFDVTSSRGYMIYSFGLYKYCGMNKFGQRNIICISTSDGKRFALNVSIDEINADSIDKKILNLLSEPEFKSISIFGNAIFVSPELGELSFQPSIGGFGYDPVLIKSVASTIDSKVAKSGIDSSKYKVINPYR